MLNVLTTTKIVLNDLRLVRINRNEIESLVKNMSKNNLNVSEINLAKYEWDGKKLIELIFVFNAINFCFWAGKGEKKWEIAEDNLNGSVALFRCLENEARINPNFLSGKYLAGLKQKDLARILKGNVEIPLLEERLVNLRNLGEIVREKFVGSILNILDQSNYDAYKLVEITVDNFECFRDESSCNSKKIGFYKRAQLNAKMVNDVLILKKTKGLKSLEKLTAFADYKIPQILRSLGILEYNKVLSDRIDNLEIIERGSREEIEIRAATIGAVEIIKAKLKPKFALVTAAHIDSMLWLRSQKSQDEKPYHRTITTAY